MSQRRPNPTRITGWRCPVCGRSAVIFGVERRRGHRWSRRQLVHVDCRPDPAKVAEAMGLTRLALVAFGAVFGLSSVAESAGWISGAVAAGCGALSGLPLLLAFVSARRWPT